MTFLWAAAPSLRLRLKPKSRFMDAMLWNKRISLAIYNQHYPTTTTTKDISPSPPLLRGNVVQLHICILMVFCYHFFAHLQNISRSDTPHIHIGG